MNIINYFKKRKMIIMLGILGLIGALTGLSYAIFQQIYTNTNNQIVSTGTLSINLGTCTSLTADMTPISNIDGMLLPGCNITVHNNGSLPASYKVKLYNNPTGDLLNYLEHELLWISFDEGEPVLINELIKEDDLIVVENDIVYILYEGSVGSLGTNIHNIKIWIDDEAEEEIINKSINFIVEIEAIVSELIPSVASGNIHVDYDINMIPVSYDASGATVRADETNTDPIYKWFDYCQNTNSGEDDYDAACEFRWANVVLVKSSGENSREDYKKAVPGTGIDEEDILAYLVYVPRYRYQLFNVGFNDVGSNPERTIDVVFEDKDTPKSNGSTNGTWLTHPAFTFGETELNGIWVGKFTTSPDGESNCFGANNESNCNVSDLSTIPIIKPNMNLWSNISVINAFTISRQFQNISNYGIYSSSIDSHMMKNMEWGAVAYLSQSIYGKQGNQGTEVWNNDFIYYHLMLEPFFNSGCCGYDVDSAHNYSRCEYSFGEPGNEEASTTGSQYGIYDMSGGANEYVMGNMAASGVSLPGSINPGSSGFIIPYPDFKYYNSYLYTSSSVNYSNSHLGDATGETRGWYDDNSIFLNLSDLWFIRGGSAEEGSSSGVFFFEARNGEFDPITSFRITIIVE